MKAGMKGREIVREAVTRDSTVRDDPCHVLCRSLAPNEVLEGLKAERGNGTLERRSHYLRRQPSRNDHARPVGTGLIPIDTDIREIDNEKRRVRQGEATGGYS